MLVSIISIDEHMHSMHTPYAYTNALIMPFYLYGYKMFQCKLLLTWYTVLLCNCIECDGTYSINVHVL